MGRGKMAFHLARLLCLPLLCLLLSVLAQVSGRLDRKHYLVKTEDNDDNIRDENNDYSGSSVSTSPKGYTPASSNIQKDEDYTGSDQNKAGADYQAVYHRCVRDRWYCELTWRTDCWLSYPYC